jgi:hypothetical protein
MEFCSSSSSSVTPTTHCRGVHARRSVLSICPAASAGVTPWTGLFPTTGPLRSARRSVR